MLYKQNQYISRVWKWLLLVMVVFLINPSSVEAYPKASNGVRLTDGALVTTENQGVYLLEGEKKHPFSSVQVFRSHDYDFSQVQTISDTDFQAIESGSPIELRGGTLAVNSENQRAYLIEEGRKRYIPSPAIVEASVYEFGDGILVSPNVLNDLPDGQNYTDPNYIVNGTPIFSQNTGIYLVQNDRKRPFPSLTTFESWFDSGDARRVSSEKMSVFSTGERVLPRDRTLIADENSVYLVENGKKRVFYTIDQFLNGGFDFANVNQVTDDFVASLEEGSPMEVVDDGPEVPSPPDADESFIRTLGGSDVNDDTFLSVAETKDNGSVSAGWSENYGGKDADGYVTKVNSAGEEVWEKTLGGDATDIFYDIAQTQDDGYIAVGSSISYGNDDVFDGYAVKLDSEGNEEWSKTLGGGSTDVFLDVEQNNGNYIAVGYSKSYGENDRDGYVVNLNSAGEENWTKIFGGDSEDSFASVDVTKYGGYILAGESRSYGGNDKDGYLVKLRSDGNQQGSQVVGGDSADAFSSVKHVENRGMFPRGEKCYPNTVVPFEDRCYIVTGYSESYGGSDKDGYVMKLDLNGRTVWSKTLGGDSSDRFSGIDDTNDKGFIVTGASESYGGSDKDGYVVKLGFVGNEQWTKTMGGDSMDVFTDLYQTQKGDYVAGGYSQSYGGKANSGYMARFIGDGDSFTDCDACNEHSQNAQTVSQSGELVTEGPSNITQNAESASQSSNDIVQGENFVCRNTE